MSWVYEIRKMITNMTHRQQWNVESLNDKYYRYSERKKNSVWKLTFKRKSKVKLLSHVWLFETPRAVTYQAPLSMGFSRQEYWSGLPFPSPGDLPNPGIEPRSLALQTDALPSEPRKVIYKLGQSLNCSGTFKESWGEGRLGKEYL